MTDFLGLILLLVAYMHLALGSKLPSQSLAASIAGDIDDDAARLIRGRSDVEVVVTADGTFHDATIPPVIRRLAEAADGTLHDATIPPVIRRLADAPARNLVDNAGALVREPLADACTKGPEGKDCENGGTATGRTRKCTCNCQSGYGGVYCETAIHKANALVQESVDAEVATETANISTQSNVKLVGLVVVAIIVVALLVFVGCMVVPHRRSGSLSDLQPPTTVGAEESVRAVRTIRSLKETLMGSREHKDTEREENWILKEASIRNDRDDEVRAMMSRPRKAQTVPFADLFSSLPFIAVGRVRDAMGLAMYYAEEQHSPRRRTITSAGSAMSLPGLEQRFKKLLATAGEWKTLKRGEPNIMPLAEGNLYYLLGPEKEKDFLLCVATSNKEYPVATAGQILEELATTTHSMPGWDTIEEWMGLNELLVPKMREMAAKYSDHTKAPPAARRLSTQSDASTN